MSTRCLVVITDKWSRPNGDGVLFYRHSDGYPEGVQESLTQFIDLIKNKYIRDNACQSAGWLVMIGNAEYAKKGDADPYGGASSVADLLAQEPDINGGSWKVGAYEPTFGVHCNIEYLYVVDVSACTIEVFEDFDAHKATVAEFLSRKGVPLEIAIGA